MGAIVSQQYDLPQYQHNPYQPPKPKSHKGRNALIILAAVIGILVVIGVAAAGGGANKPQAGTTTTAPPAASQQSVAPSKPAASKPVVSKPASDGITHCTGDRHKPCVVALGKPFALGKHRMEKGWKLQTQEYLGTQLVGKLTNTSNDASMAYFHVKFLQGKSVVANFQCATSDDLEPGQDEQVECVNMVDVKTSLKPGNYTSITAEADF